MLDRFIWRDKVIRKNPSNGDKGKELAIKSFFQWIALKFLRYHLKNGVRFCVKPSLKVFGFLKIFFVCFKMLTITWKDNRISSIQSNIFKGTIASHHLSISRHNTSHIVVLFRWRYKMCCVSWYKDGRFQLPLDVFFLCFLKRN